MDHTLIDRIAQACPPLFGQALEALLAPIDGAASTGIWLRGDGVYRAIERARKFDDASLPMGAWEHELKRAEWDQVIGLASKALAHQSKDLQLAAWLLEAQIHQHGFAGVASSLHLISQLCACYWDELYPPADGGDLAHRANVLRWIDEKLPNALRQVPLALGANDQLFGLADWERANRRQQTDNDGTQEGAARDELATALAGAALEACSAMAQQVRDARSALCALEETSSACFGDQAPSLNAFDQVLEQACALLDTELYRRGVRHHATDLSAPEQPCAPLPAPYGDGTIRNRAEAYARLNEAAGYLLQIEPHSPVPYLIRRASEWGQLNAVELYQELFVRQGGQLNIFDMLGLGQPDHAALER